MIHEFKVTHYDIPKGYLCPRVPQRLQYLEWIKDLFAQVEGLTRPLLGFDIGVGANFIYPLIGIKKYGWRFAGSEVNKSSIEWAETKILKANPDIEGSFLGIRLQSDPLQVLTGVITQDEERFDFCMCNPPFFNSEDERKLRKSSVRVYKMVIEV